MTTQELMSLSINSEFLGSLIGSDKCYIQPVCASDKSIPPLVTSYAFNNKNLSKSLVYQSIDKLREINFQQFSEYHQDQARFFAKNWIDVLKKIYPDHNFLSTDDTEIMACIQDIIQLLETTSAKEINRHLAECQSERQDFTIASGLHYDMVSGDRFVMNMTVLRNFVMAFDRNKFEYYTEIAIHDSIEDCSEIEIKLADEVSDQDTKKIALLLNYNIDRDFTKKLAIKIVFSGRVEPTNDEIGAYFAKNKNIAIPDGIDTNTFIKQLLMKEAAEVRKDFLTKYHIYTALVKEGY